MINAIDMQAFVIGFCLEISAFIFGFYLGYKIGKG